MAHIQNYTKHDFETKIAPFFLLTSEKEMLIKRIQDVGIQNFEVIYEEQVMAHIQNHKNTTSKHVNCTIFPLNLRDQDADKTRFKPVKTQKMTTFFRTLEFKTFRLFMKNK
jgi:hypothetical protein